MVEISSGFVIALGMGTTFFGLICIILLSMLMSFFCRIGNKSKQDEKKSEVSAPAPAVAPAQSAQIPNKGEFVAAVSAAIAEDMGTDVSSIRILSIKKV